MCPDTLPSITLAVPIPGKVAVTDSDGEFLIDALAPGDYSLAPAFLTSDGYVQDDLHWDNRFTLTESDTVQLGNVEVLKAISPENPPDGSEITDGAPEFRWEALPDSLGLTAASYELWWSTGYMMYGPISVEEPRWQWPEQSPLQPGSHIRWEIQVLAVGALSEEPMVVATFECHATFTVAP